MFDTKSDHDDAVVDGELGSVGDLGLSARHEGLVLTLEIDDPDTVEALAAFPEGRARDRYARTALRIGVLALEQARSRIDVERLRDEGTRMLDGMQEALAAHHRALTGDVSRALNDYFDPRSGRMTQRIDDLFSNGGQLERTIRQQVGTENSPLAETLNRFLGTASPIMTVIDPESQQGLAASLTKSVDAITSEQRERILREFSLDNAEGALSRTVRELSERHGAAGADLEKKIGEMVGEFSLDNKDSALSRLVQRVEHAQKVLTDEFSLDRDGSALARMRKELLSQIEALAKAQAAFQADISGRLAEMTARKAESLRSTRHGEDFEAQLFQEIDARAQARHDIATAVGATTGLIRNCKKGDILIELGPDHAAPGVKIIIEAKQEAGFSFERARREIEDARRNRAARIGLFVFSQRTAPPGLDRIRRVGEDIFLTWDADDTGSDLVLDVGLSLASAMAASLDAGSQTAVGLVEMERAILEIEKQIGYLDEFEKSADTIMASAGKIHDRNRKMRMALKREIETLNTCLDSLRRD